MQELDTKITSMLETQNTINILQTKYIENNSILNSLYKTIQKNYFNTESLVDSNCFPLYGGIIGANRSAENCL